MTKEKIKQKRKLIDIFFKQKKWIIKVKANL